MKAEQLSLSTLFIAIPRRLLSTSVYIKNRLERAASYNSLPACKKRIDRLAVAVVDGQRFGAHLQGAAAHGGHMVEADDVGAVDAHELAGR
jgi:hypothetical protein